MATLPPLKSGRVVQYPVSCTIEQRIDTIGFLDGSEQRSAITRPLRRWRVALQLLDEEELASLTSFVVEQKGRAGSFEFTDPSDGVTYPRCSFGGDEWTATLIAEGRLSTELTIWENPS
jgi:hypothetical protein